MVMQRRTKVRSSSFLTPDIFREMPILGCVRRGDTIIDATNRLLTHARLRRDEVVGRQVREVWPHASEWIVLDRKAERSGCPLETIEFSRNLGWLRSKRVTDKGIVVWTAETITADLALGAIKMLAGVSSKALCLGPREHAFIEALVARKSEADIRQQLGLSFEDTVGACMRLLSQV